jgi:hypothetical protein
MGGKPATRGRRDKLTRNSKPEAPPPHRPFQIALMRARQGCYGICGGSFVAIPAAMLGEHAPAMPTVVVMTGMALFAGATGLLIEIFERRIFPGGTDGS